MAINSVLFGSHLSSRILPAKLFLDIDLAQGKPVPGHYFNRQAACITI